MGLREQGESQGSGGGATPLVGATAKLLKFVYEQKKHLQAPTPTSTQQGSRGKAKEKEERKEDGRLWIRLCRGTCVMP